MDGQSDHEKAVELLQKLGLKEYEAKSFVALARLPSGTAKEVSEVSEVPRTRIYDAMRVLETKGLIEIQHTNPQQFRAVPIEEAVDTLKSEYDSRMETLRETLRGLDSTSTDTDAEITHEVWALSGKPAIANRTRQLIGEAEEELVFVIGHESAVDEQLIDELRSARRGGVNVIVGTTADDLRDRLETALPDAEVFVSGLEWLGESAMIDDATEISRLLLVDRSTILVSTFHTTADGEESDERAVFGRGFENGFVAIARRLMATGLFPESDPGINERPVRDEGG